MEHFEDISFKKLMGMLYRHIAFIVAFVMLSGVVSFLYTRIMVKPEYEASVTLYVRNEVEKSMNKTLGSDIQTAQMLVDTYIIIIKSDTVLNEVCKKLYEQGIYTYDAERLRKSISASSINSTEVFQVFVRNDDLSTTHIIANMIATVAPSIIQDFVEASSVKVVDYAVKGKMVSPNVNKNMFLSLVIGLFVGCMLVIIREIFDTRVKTEDELVDWFKLPILGVIPDIDESKSHKAGYLYKGSAYGNQKEGY